MGLIISEKLTLKKTHIICSQVFCIKNKMMPLDTTYLRKLGLFKIAEIICLAIAFATYESQLSDVSITLRPSVLNYYLTSIMVTCALFVIWFVVNSFGLIRKSTNVLAISLLHVVLGCMLFAPSCVYVHSAVAYPVTVHDLIITSYVFGMISSVLIFIDALFHHVVAASESSETA